MDFNEIKGALDGIDDTQKKILEKQAEVEAKVAGLDALEEKVGSTEKWLAEVDKKASRARYPEGSNGPDELKNAIPERHRNLAAKFEASGCDSERAIKKAAMESWAKNALHLQMGNGIARHGINPKDPVALREEQDKLSKAFGDAYQRATYTEGTAATGGNVVPSPLMAEVHRIMEDAGIVRPLVRRIPMSADTLAVPTKGGNVTAYIIAESGTITQGEGTFGQETLTAKKFGAYGLVSSELLQDSAVGLVDFFFTDAAEQIALLEDDEALEGDGTNFTGLNSATGVLSVTNGANGSLPTYAKLVEQKWAAGKSQSRRNACWITAPEVAYQIEALVDSNGNPIWKESGIHMPTGLREGGASPDGRILGFDAFTSEQVATDVTTGTEGNTSRIFFGNFMDGMLFGDRTEMSFGLSEHVGFASDTVGIRLLKRTGILVVLPALFSKQTGVHTE